MNNLLQKLQLGGSTLALLTASTFFAVPTYAQTATTADSLDTVVVTGTSIRGVAPVGSNLITVGQEDIAKTGAQNVQQLLANVPAITGMGNGGEGGSIHNNYYQPSIHQLGASASNATLVLLDGHRPPTGGTNHSTADPNIVPSNMIERVEVIANGTSATYGSDAVAGVINFITRKRFDGVQLTAEAQILDGAVNENFGVLTGTSWEKGSAIFAYQFYNQNKLFSRNRPYTYPDQTARALATGIPITSNSSATNNLSFTCPSPRIRVNGTGDYIDVATGTHINSTASNADCTDWASNSTLENESQRNNAMIKISQDITDNFTVSADLVYATRREHSIGGRGSVSNITVFGTGAQANPFYTNPPGTTSTKQTVYFNLNDLLGGNTVTGLQGSDDGLVDVSGEYRIGDNFVVDAAISSGRDESYSLSNGGTLNSSAADLALNGTTNSTGSTTQPSIPGQATVVTNLPLTTANALDVWHTGAANQTSQAVKDALLDSRSLTRNVATFQQARLSTNGTAFTLPGGDVKVAVGAETTRYQLMQEGVQSNNTGSASNGSTHTLFLFHRKVDSAFMELNIPVIGPDMNIPLVRSFQINASGRYDNYTDAGSTQNPKLAFAWEVIEGLHLRGNMSTSFVAPGLDVSGDPHGAFLTTQFTGTTITTPIPVAAFPAVTLFPATFFNGGAACTTANTTCTLTSTVQGGFINNGDPNAKPQKGRGWEIGVDYAPDFVPGLTTSATLWNTQFEGGITGPNIGNILNNAGLNHFLTFYPAGISGTAISALATGIRQSGSVPTTGYFVYYSTNTNILNLYIQGVDFDIKYGFDVDNWGHFRLGSSGSIFTKYDESYGLPASNAARFSVLNTTGANSSFPSIQIQTRWDAGWDMGPYTADVYMNYTGGYRNWSGTSLTPLTKDALGNPNGGGDPVKANVTFDLHLGYDFTAPYVGGDEELSLTVRNIFDKTPPFYLGSSGFDSWAGSPLGRVVTIGLKAKL